MSKKLRREPRVDHQMPMTVHYGNGAQIYQSQNVAYRGVFLETPDPIQLNKLVKLTVDIDEKTLEFLALVARRVNQFDAAETGKAAGMGLSIYSIGESDAEQWETFVQRLYHMDEEARRELELKELKKLHLIVDSGEPLKDMVKLAKSDNYIDYSSQRPLEVHTKHLFTITHSADHSLRASLMVKILEHPTVDYTKSVLPILYRLEILDQPEDRDEALELLCRGE